MSYESSETGPGAPQHGAGRTDPDCNLLHRLGVLPDGVLGGADGADAGALHPRRRHVPAVRQYPLRPGAPGGAGAGAPPGQRRAHGGAGRRPPPRHAGGGQGLAQQVPHRPSGRPARRDAGAGLRPGGRRPQVQGRRRDRRHAPRLPDQRSGGGGGHRRREGRRGGERAGRLCGGPLPAARRLPLRRGAAGLLRPQRRRSPPRPQRDGAPGRGQRGSRHFHPHPALLVRHDPHGVFPLGERRGPAGI